MNIKLSIITGLSLACLIPTSLAQDITGAWSFETRVERKGCTLTGNMSISPADKNGIRTCSFVSNETCQSEPGISIKMDQACRITPQSDSYIIRSKVIGTLTEGYSISNYLADHFTVSPTSAKEMRGIWQDARYSSRVVFWRDDDLPVS
jgi:hypothetical protein